MNFLMSFADFFAKGGPLHVAHSSVFRTRSRHSPVQDVGIYDSPAYARKNQTGRLHSPALVFGTHLRTTGDSRRRNVIPHSEQAGQEAGAGARRPGVDHDDRTHPGAYRHSDRHDQHISSDRGTRITGGSFRARRGYMEALITTAAGLLVALPAHVAYHFLENRLSELIQTVQEIVDVRRIAFCGISHEN